MKFNLLPKEKIFYELLEKHADLIHEAGEVFHNLVTQWEIDAPETKERVQVLGNLEHSCDSVIHTLMIKLNKTFITPIDREDVYRLSKKMDDIVDILQSVSERMVLFRVNTISEDFLHMAEIMNVIVGLVRQAVYRVRNLENPQEIIKLCEEIGKCETQGDRALEQAMGRLFQGDIEPLEVIKWNELYDSLEEGIDKCEDVADTIESIVVKYG